MSTFVDEERNLLFTYDKGVLKQEYLQKQSTIQLKQFERNFNKRRKLNPRYRRPKPIKYLKTRSFS